jgi:hypothetical protein
LKRGLSREALGAIGYRVGRDAIEPRGERRAAPLELTQVSQGLMENVRSQLLGSRSFANAPRDVGIHPFEVELVQLGKTAGIILCRLYQGSFFLLIRETLQD